jgi:hypothetical protein
MEQARIVSCSTVRHRKQDASGKWSAVHASPSDAGFAKAFSMSRYLFGSSPGGEAGPAPRVTAVSSDDEEPDWMRVLAAPTPAPAFPLPESSSEEPIMPVSKAAKPTPEETTQPGAFLPVGAVSKPPLSPAH